jgi:hypothetical protein
MFTVRHGQRMSRRKKTSPHRQPAARATVEQHLPPDLRGRLEAARIDLLGLFRALDSLHIAAHLPDELHDLFELDADFAEALAVLDHSPAGYDLVMMLRETLTSLDDLAAAKADFLATLDESDRARLDRRLPVVCATLDPREAYSQIPGRDPRLA